MRASTVLKSLQRVTSSGIYIPEVDQLRFLAIFTVLYCHVADSFQSAYHWFSPAIYGFLENGANGVRLFFAISGFVLFLPFFQHSVESRPFSPRKFYVRRLTRLEPTFIIAVTFFYLMAVWVSGRVLGLSHYLATITYTHQLIYRAPSTILPLTWTLEVEFQFYLLVPIFSQIARVSRMRRRLALAGVILLSIYFNRLVHFPTRNLLTEAHHFLAGILAADLYANEIRSSGSPFGIFVGRLPAVLSVLFLFGVMKLDARNGSPVEILIFLLSVLGLMLMFLRKARSTGSPIPGPLAVLGGMCYTIYLYHVLFIGLSKRIVDLFSPRHLALRFTCFSICAFALVCIACPLLFLAFEKPFMQRRPFHRLAARWSRQTP